MDQRKMAPGGQANLIGNPDFELPGAGGADLFSLWTELASNGVITDETSDVHSGAHAVKLTAGSTVGTSVFQELALTPGRTYRLTFWSHGDGAQAPRYRVQDVTHTAEIIGPTSTTVTGATYQKTTASFAVPAACVSVRVTFYCPAVNASTGYIDDVKLVAL